MKLKLMKASCLLCLCCLIIFACQQESASGLKPKSLLTWGIPLKVMAPDSLTVKKSKLGQLEDITLMGHDEFSNYNLQIFARNAPTIEVATAKKEQLENAKGNPFFTKVVEEEENGFIFEKQLDSTRVNYDFRYIRIQGDREYVFQTSLIGSFSKEDVKMMYQAVKQVTKN
ncbi:MAG: hypothetical protein AB8G15_09485 [Saprospiraceae bacterium]